MKIFTKIKNIYYNIKNGIPNLIIWLPVIWADRNWDFFYIWLILNKKLKLMEKNIRINGYHINNKKDARQIEICTFLLNRLIKDEYHENVFKNHDKKWGNLQLTWEETTNDLCKVNIHRDNTHTKQEKNQEIKESKRLYKKVDQMKKQDIDYLFTYMAKHIQGWWD